MNYTEARTLRAVERTYQIEIRNKKIQELEAEISNLNREVSTLLVTCQHEEKKINEVKGVEVCTCCGRQLRRI